MYFELGRNPYELGRGAPAGILPEYGSHAES